VSQDQVETVRRFIEAGVRDDLEGMLACLHPEVEMLPLRASTEGAFRGHEGWKRFRADTWSHYEKFEPRYKVADLGDGVIVFGAILVRGMGSGVEMEVPSAGIFEFRDGLIARWEDFGSKERALEMAGLSPDAA
jgi:ketosteroid isomerase-like protein